MSGKCRAPTPSVALDPIAAFTQAARQAVGADPAGPTIGNGVDPRCGNAAAAESLAKGRTPFATGKGEKAADPFDAPFDLLGGAPGSGGDADAGGEGVQVTGAGKKYAGGAGVSSEGFTGAFGRMSGAGGGQTTGGFLGIGEGGPHGGITHQEVKKRDDKGEMKEGSKSGASLSKEGLGLSHEEKGPDGKSKVDLGFSGDGISGKVKTDDATKGGPKHTNTVGGHVGQDSVGVEGAAERGAVKVSAGMTVHSGTSAARDADPTVGEHIGPSYGVTRKEGLSGKVGAKASGGGFSAGVSAKGEAVSKVGFHKRDAGASAAAPAGPYATKEKGFEDAHKGRLAGVHGLGDIDLDGLGAGEAYSFEQQSGKGIDGELGAVGVSVGLGYSDKAREQTVLSRTDKDTLRVSMSAAEGSETKGKASALDAAEYGHTERSGKGASVGFTAKGEAGKRAVADLQSTGLLPGVENIAPKLAPKAWEAFRMLRDEYRTMAPLLAMSPLDAQAMRARLYAAAAPLNQAFLASKDHDLSDTSAPGVTYDDHTTSRTEEKKSSVSLLGWKVMEAGFGETDWDAKYGEGGQQHTEHGYEREDAHWIAEDEKSRVITDPKGFDAKAGETPELVMFSEWVTGQQSRDAMVKLGPDAFDLPPEAIEGWRTGKMKEGNLDRLSVTLTQKQLDLLTKIVKADGDVDELAKGAVDVGRAALARGEDDSMNPVARAMAPKTRADEEDATLERLFQEASAEGLSRQTFKNPYLAMPDMMKRLASVRSAEDFLGLTPKERRALVIASAVDAARKDAKDKGSANPWESMRLALQIPDEKERGALIRELFATIERSRDGANAPIDFVRFVQAEAPDAATAKQILASTKVKGRDEGLAAANGEVEGAGDAPEKRRSLARAAADDLHAALKVGPPMFENSLATVNTNDENDLQRSPAERRADTIADALLAMRREGGPEGVEETVAAGLKRDPKFVDRIREAVAKDKPRAAIVEYALRGTSHGR